MILLPKDTGFQARRYQAKFQLDRSAAERLVIEVTVALPLPPGRGPGAADPNGSGAGMERIGCERAGSAWGSWGMRPPWCWETSGGL